MKWVWCRLCNGGAINILVAVTGHRDDRHADRHTFINVQACRLLIQAYSCGQFFKLYFSASQRGQSPSLTPNPPPLNTSSNAVLCSKCFTYYDFATKQLKPSFLQFFYTTCRMDRQVWPLWCLQCRALLRRRVGDVYGLTMSTCSWIAV